MMDHKSPVVIEPLVIGLDPIFIEHSYVSLGISYRRREEVLLMKNRFSPLFFGLIIEVGLVGCTPRESALQIDPSLIPSPTVDSVPSDNNPDTGNPGWNRAEGIDGPIYSLDWSPDGRWLASAGWGQVIVWEAETGVVSHVLEEPESYIWSVAWAPEGDYLAAGGVDGVVRIWSAPEFFLEQGFGQRWVFCLAWSPGGDQLAVGYQGGDIEVFDWRSGEVLSHMRAGSLVISLDWSADGEWLASGTLSGEVSVWDAATGEEMISFDDYTQARSDANGVAWSPDGEMLASAHQDGIVRLWDVSQGEMLMELDGHLGWARGLAWSNDGRFLASSGYDSNVIVWDARSGEIVTTYGGQTMPVWAVAWSPDNQMIASGSGYYETTDLNGEIWVWEFSRP
jgi:WD40 repeat protein